MQSHNVYFIATEILSCISLSASTKVARRTALALAVVNLVTGFVAWFSA